MRWSSARTELAVLLGVLVAYGILSGLVVNPYYQLILTLVVVWASFATAWNIFSGYSGLVSFGHSAFFGLGAYGVILLDLRWNVSPWAGIPIVGASGAVAGVVIGFPTFRLRRYYFALAMLSYPVALQNLFQWLGLQEVTLPLHREDAFAFMQFSDPHAYTLLGVGMLAICLVAAFAVEHSRFGMSLGAIKQNEPAAEAIGIDTLRWKLRAVALSGALAAAAGGLYTVVVLIITPDAVFGTIVSAQALILTMFGGIGTLWGPVIGAVVLVPLSEAFRAWFGDVLPGIQGVIYGIAIIAIIFYAPEGLFWRLKDRFTRHALPSPSLRENCVAKTEVRTMRAATDAVVMEVRGIAKSFGGLRAVDDVSFSIRQGSILGIIGPNGAGKTTLFNLLNGFLPPDSGTVTFGARNITGLKPSTICRIGIARTFQVVRPFLRMTVLENVVVGAYVRTSSNREALEFANAAVQLVGLGARKHILAGSLTNKELRLLELARALSSKPRILLMDEVFAGLGRDEVDEVLEIIEGLRVTGITIVIIEHTMEAMMRLVDEFVVLDHGKVIAAGKPRDISKAPVVIEAYLGKKWAATNAVN
jgi:ABC-type branched-subunit amino acid transport system ATPase component/ABC-type branched-subunit amino acid transport system permease subunit